MASVPDKHLLQPTLLPNAAHRKKGMIRKGKIAVWRYGPVTSLKSKMKKFVKCSTGYEILSRIMYFLSWNLGNIFQFDFSVV